MARFGIVFGLLLCGLTLVGLVGTNEKVPSQFFPMMLGIPLLFCGVVSLNPHRRRQAIGTAAALSGLGAVAGGGRVVYCLLGFAGDDFNRYAFNLTVTMTALCTLFTAVCIVSFRAMRRKAELRIAAEAAINLHTPATNDSKPDDVPSRESA